MGAIVDETQGKPDLLSLKQEAILRFFEQLCSMILLCIQTGDVEAFNAIVKNCEQVCKEGAKLFIETHGTGVDSKELN